MAELLTSSRTDGFSAASYLSGTSPRKGTNSVTKRPKSVSNRDGGGIKGLSNMHALDFMLN